MNTTKHLMNPMVTVALLALAALVWAGGIAILMLTANAQGEVTLPGYIAGAIVILATPALIALASFRDQVRSMV